MKSFFLHETLNELSFASVKTKLLNNASKSCFTDVFYASRYIK